MVEVIVAFTVLVLIVGIFSRSLSLAGRIAASSEEQLAASRNLAKAYYYLEEDGSIMIQEAGAGGEAAKFATVTKTETPKTLRFKSTSNASDGFQMGATLREYTYDDGTRTLSLYELVPGR